MLVVVVVARTLSEEVILLVLAALEAEEMAATVMELLGVKILAVVAVEQEIAQLEMAQQAVQA
jgi:hypothetical protein